MRTSHTLGRVQLRCLFRDPQRVLLTQTPRTQVLEDGARNLVSYGA